MKRMMIIAIVTAVMVFVMAGGVFAYIQDEMVFDYQKTESKFVLAFDTTHLIGKMDVNGFNFPTAMFGVTGLLGLDLRYFTNIPDSNTIERITANVLYDHPFITRDALYEEVYQKSHPGVFKYMQYGTELLIIPKIGMGMLIPFSKDINNLGYIDVGLNFPCLLNVGIIVAF